MQHHTTHLASPVILSSTVRSVTMHLPSMATVSSCSPCSFSPLSSSCSPNPTFQFKFFLSARRFRVIISAVITVSPPSVSNYFSSFYLPPLPRSFLIVFIYDIFLGVVFPLPASLPLLLSLRFPFSSSSPFLPMHQKKKFRWSFPCQRRTSWPTRPTISARHRSAAASWLAEGGSETRWKERKRGEEVRKATNWPLNCNGLIRVNWSPTPCPASKGLSNCLILPLISVFQ